MQQTLDKIIKNNVQCKKEEKCGGDWYLLGKFQYNTKLFVLLLDSFALLVFCLTLFHYGQYMTEKLGDTYTAAGTNFK